MTGASDWAGAVGLTWAAEWRRTDLSFAELAPVLNAAILAAVPEGAARALDVGCGAGATSLALAAARPDLAVTGVDISPELIAVARERADGIANLSFVEGDVLTVAAELAPLDLIVSRHGVMFFDDPVSAFATLRAAAAPHAALVFSCFRSVAENGWATAVAAAVSGEPPASPSDAPGPFAFADDDRVAAILTRAGWHDVVPRKVDYRNRTGGGDDPVADAVAFFSRIGPAAPPLRALPPAERDAALRRLADLCRDHCHDGSVDFPAAAWIWTARAGH